MKSDSAMIPEILAPAGDRSSFLAALAAGADAVYMGLKNFSARMEAKNFSTSELSQMVELAESEKRHIYVAFNTIFKADDLKAAGSLVKRLARDVHPYGLIVQDLAMIELARQIGYEGKIVLSTLANVTHPKALLAAQELGANRVVLPRELSLDEIRQISDNCPDDLDLEIFIHGALCWNVSGRCYWSSYMGGKSGLRGRCVQPCRRMYTQRGHTARFFSCLDFSLDVLSKTLLDIPHLASWKIEGRKKGPHYVYHVVRAYRMIRDNPDVPQVRRDAEDILKMSLGRPTTHAGFLPQHNLEPTSPDAQTSSGLLVGKVRIGQDGTPFFKAHMALQNQDYLRLGYEDEIWHDTFPVRRHVPKAGTFVLPKHKTPKIGTPVFLIDRRETELLRLLKEWGTKLDQCTKHEARSVEFTPRMPAVGKKSPFPDIHLRSTLPKGPENRSTARTQIGIWLSPRSLREISRTVVPKISWWLPPVIWVDEEKVWENLIQEGIRKGIKHLVCNAPWQVKLIQEQQTNLIAGPFCNLSNPLSLTVIAKMGFKAAFVSPELDHKTFLELPKLSPIPLGFVLKGFFPMGIGRHNPEGLKANEAFQSPKRELFWTRKYGENTWIYPAWEIDFTAKREELAIAGYSFFATIEENLPKSLPASTRPGLFNWDSNLL